MGEILITFTKQTAAYNLKKAASRAGIRVKIVQTPKEISRGGCSYGVLAMRTEMSKMMSLCKSYNIEYMRVFALHTDASGKKSYSQI